MGVPQVTWPTLGDGDGEHNVEAFFEEYEDIVGLANDGRGMAPVEKLRCRRQRLKQSRRKVYNVVRKESRRNGFLERDPEATYQRVYDRLMEFQETPFERQNRVETRAVI